LDIKIFTFIFSGPEIGRKREEIGEKLGYAPNNSICTAIVFFIIFMAPPFA